MKISQRQQPQRSLWSALFCKLRGMIRGGRRGRSSPRLRTRQSIRAGAEERERSARPSEGDRKTRQQSIPLAGTPEPAKKRRRGKWLGRDGCRVRGTQFGGLVHVPVDPRVDAKPCTCFNCRRPGHRMAECAEPRTRAVCYNCGRLDVTMLTCPRCGPTYSGFLAQKKEAAAVSAVVSAAQATDSNADAISPRAVEAAALSIEQMDTTPADTPARKKKCRRSKKKKAQQPEVQLPSPSRTPPPRIDPCEPSTSKGTTYERFCHSLSRLSPTTQDHLKAVWNGEHVCSSDSPD